MILANARVGGVVVNLVVENGAIAGITPVGATIPPGPAVDLEGRVVLPGLWDEHVHMTQWAIARRRVDVSAATSAQEAAQWMRDAASERTNEGEGVLLTGQGFRDGLWPHAPTAAMLDAVINDRPVAIISGDLHACWLNTVALQRFGFANHPTGLLREDECFAVVPRLDEADESTVDAWVADAGAAAAARGVVGIVDMEMPFSLPHWQRRMASGFDSQRVWASVYPSRIDEAIATGLSTGDPVGPLLSMGYAKVITDGSLNTRTAYCADSYPGTTDRGMLTVEPAALRSLLDRAVAAGLVPAVHAIGDDANRHALDVLEALGVGGRIEHAQLLHDHDLARFAAAGIIASIQPEHAMDDRDVAEHHWAGRTHRGYIAKGLLDASATIVLGSDAPVAPLDPWVSIDAAVTRTRDGRDPWHPEQAISVAQAIAASARTTIAVGQPADLVVLDDDPATASLRTMPVAATLLAGRPTWWTLG